MNEVRRLTLVIYLFANLALAVSLALPAAGMVNHLLPGESNPGRGLLLWLAGVAACLLLSLPLLPWIQRRVRRRINRQAESPAVGPAEPTEPAEPVSR